MIDRHDDQPCPNENRCPACQLVNDAFVADKIEFSTRPHPTNAELHDMPRYGAVGRCPSCGGRTYLLDTGEWCTRAFCQPNGQQVDR